MTPANQFSRSPAYNHWEIGSRTRISTKWERLGVFALFCTNGPGVRFFGEFRYLEIAILTLLVVHARTAIIYLGKWERRFILLFATTAAAQVVADTFTQANADGTIRRAGTYTLLIFTFAGIRALAKRDPSLVLCMLAGYAASFGIVYAFGIQTASASYLDVPWRLGLGAAVTLGIVIGAALSDRIYRYSGELLLLIAAIHWLSGSRGSTVIAAATGLAVLYSRIRKRSTPRQLRGSQVINFVVLTVAAGALLYAGLKTATEHDLFPLEMQDKMEAQFNSPYGILAGARPDTAAAIYAISKSPLIGHGSTNIDPDVWNLYSSLAAYSLTADPANYDRLVEETLNRDWSQGTPSHSHVFGAWADAGIFAALSWLVMLWVAVYVSMRVIGWKHRYVPLFVLVSLESVMTILFSPGPVRVDIGLKLLVLITALEFIKFYRATASAHSQTLR